MSADGSPYGIGDLADLGGVTRRTVRYYVQEGLLPAPLGVGRGRHYGPQHLDRLLQVKALQEAGRSLGEIRQALAGEAAEERNATAHPTVPAAPAAPARSLWRRLVLAPGVELHVASDLALPSPARLHELTTWCRAHVRGREDDEDHG